MDNRVIGIGILVVVLAAYVRGVPQKVYALIRGGKATTLGATIQSATGANSTPSDAVAQSVGGQNASVTNGALPGETLTQNPAGNQTAQIIAMHQQALSVPGTDPQLDDLVSKIPASNDARITGWVNAFRTCYGAGGTVNACAAQATQQTGMSIFG